MRINDDFEHRHVRKWTSSSDLFVLRGDQPDVCRQLVSEVLAAQQGQNELGSVLTLFTPLTWPHIS